MLLAVGAASGYGLVTSGKRVPLSGIRKWQKCSYMALGKWESAAVFTDYKALAVEFAIGQLIAL
jgi:hypothetical protein